MKKFSPSILMIMAVLSLLSFSGTADAQPSNMECLLKCEEKYRECGEPCKQEARTAQRECEEAGGTVAACQQSYDNTFQACLSRTAPSRRACMENAGCEMCYDWRLGISYFCKCRSYAGAACPILNYDFDFEFGSPSPAPEGCECPPGDPECNLYDPDSPIIFDVDKNGIKLTAPALGVRFDLRANGQPLKFSWTERDSDDAWLALDRNNNGKIDNGAELFGNYTPQTQLVDKNGFAALKDFDLNHDDLIDASDAVYSRLRFWQDKNHNGKSEPGELKTLVSCGVESMSVIPKESRRRDRHGNIFRYRAKVNNFRFAWDVFLKHVEE